MFPTLGDGCRLFLEKVKLESLKGGDIIGFAAPAEGGIIVHRLIAKIRNNGGLRLLTKADNNLYLDGELPSSRFLAKVTMVQPDSKADIQILTTNILSSNIYLFFGKALFFAQLHKNVIPKLLRPILQKAFNISYEVMRRLMVCFKRQSFPQANSEELLLVLARRNLDKKLKDEAIALLGREFDWERLFQLAYRQKVTALIYCSLKKIKQDISIPEDVEEKFRNLSLYIIAKDMTDYEKEKSVLNLFFNKGIAVIPLKGVFLSKNIYKDYGLRKLSVDFDLLIEEKNKEKAQAMLKEAGYVLRPVSIPEWQWQYQFYKPRAKTIDLHWDITMQVKSQARIEGLWRGVRLVEEDGVSYYELREEELLLFLSAHLVNSSRFQELLYVCDINELLDKNRDMLNWNSIVEKARRWKLSNSLYVALKLSQDLLGSDLPPQVLRKLKPNFLKFALIRIFLNKKVFLKKCFRRRLRDFFLQYVLFFEVIETRTTGEYVSILRRVFFPPREARRERNYIVRILKRAGELCRNAR